VKASAIAIAATLYQLAMRDEMLPPLPAAQMPPPVPRSSGAVATWNAKLAKHRKEGLALRPSRALR